MIISLCNDTSFDKGLQSIVINFSSLKNTQNYFFNNCDCEDCDCENIGYINNEWLCLDCGGKVEPPKE